MNPGETGRRAEGVNAALAFKFHDQDEDFFLPDGISSLLWIVINTH